MYSRAEDTAALFQNTPKHRLYRQRESSQPLKPKQGDCSSRCYQGMLQLLHLTIRYAAARNHCYVGKHIWDPFGHSSRSMRRSICRRCTYSLVHDINPANCRKMSALFCCCQDCVFVQSSVKAICYSAVDTIHDSVRPCLRYCYLLQRTPTTVFGAPFRRD